ncbi:MAG TPA: tetratricopeptide repeat protein [Flavisolibacter sp.]|nr:tetratricopeptide repeat protein [Flavisolibacter sp.]
MKKQQWLFGLAAIILVIGLYAATKNQVFGVSKVIKPVASTVITENTVSTDSILLNARKSLNPEQSTRLNFLEHSISRGDVKNQQLLIYQQLAHFWADSAKRFEPYAWYRAEEARLENSEKSLTFAAHLFLNSLTAEENPEIKKWEAFQAKDLFERSLKLNPENDSSKVGLGAVYLYGGISTPMQGVAMIRQVADKNPSDIYAQMTLGQASFASGQLDKAIERFKAVIRLEPGNIEALLLLGEVAEQMGNKPGAVEWYKKSLPFLKIPGLKKEVEARIADLSK